MSTKESTWTYDPKPPDPPKQLKTGRPRWLVPTIVGVVALSVGAGLGTAGSSTTPTATPVTVTQTVPGPTVTVPGPSVEVPGKTVEKRVEVTSPKCLRALDAADKAIGLSGEGFTIASEMMTALTNFDPDAMAAETQKLEALHPKMVKALNEYHTAADVCRADR